MNLFRNILNNKKNDKTLAYVRVFLYLYTIKIN